MVARVPWWLPCGSPWVSGREDRAPRGALVGSIRIGQSRLPLPCLAVRLARGGPGGVVVGRGRVRVVGPGRLLVRRCTAVGFPGRVDLLPIDLDEADMDEVGLQARGGLARVFALGADVRIDRHVVQAEGDQHLAIGLHGLDATSHQMAGFFRIDPRLDVPVRGLVDRARERGDAARQEWVTVLRTHVLGTVEVADAPGDDLVRLDGIELGAIDQFGLEQAAFDARGGLALALAAGAEVRVGPDVADAKAHQRSAAAIVLAEVAFHQLLGLGTGDPHVEIAVARIIRGSDQRCDLAGQERLGAPAAPDGDFADILQVADAGRVQVEVRLRWGWGIHGGSP
ncbi:hypothetical protein XAC2852_470015 [Xanthomonas citri pv. citri]|nr:hypothetical protein XAC2852_470015 [Xanthomonas citri pv. citri]